MSAPTEPVRRAPVVVIIAVILVYLSGLGNILVGVLVLLSRYRVSADEVLPISLLGSAIILLGLLTIAIASGLSRGSRFARLLVTIAVGILVILQVVTIITTDEWDAAQAIQLGLGALIILALWAPPGSRFFPRTAPSTNGPSDA